MNPWIYAILLSMMPIAELRGGIPFAIFNGIHPIAAYLICCGANLLAFPLVFIFLEFFHHRFVHWTWYEKLFNYFVERTRKKTEKIIEKYGFWALMIFVMIPLPVTGAYTGSIAAWTFNIERKRAFMSVSLGVLIAGVIVTTVVVTGSETFNFLIKHVGN